MEIHPTYAPAVKFIVFEKCHHFDVGGLGDLREVREMLQEFGAIAESAAGQFSNHPRVQENHIEFEQPDHLRIAPAQVIDPDRRVN